MKKIAILLAALVMAGSQAQAWDLKEALKGLSNGNTKEALKGALDGVLSTSKLEVSQLVGDWKYSAPAVTFKSENVLKKAGGSAASGVVESKLAPAYKFAGLDKMTLTIAEDGSFTMAIRSIKLKGKITPVTDETSKANFIFDFTIGSKSLRKAEAYVEKSASGNMKVMFDVTKLIQIMETVSKVAKNSTLSSAVSLLKSYDGLCAGFELKK